MKYKVTVAVCVFVFVLGWARTGMCKYRVTTEQGHYMLDAEFETNPITVGLHSLVLQLRAQRSDEPAADLLKIEIVSWMPVHGHGAMHVPVVTAEGNGIFHVEGLQFTMPGDWEVHIRMEADGIEDSAVFDVRVDP